MRFLLVQPPFSRFRGHKHPGEFQPFVGLGYLTEVLSRRGHCVYYYNADDNPKKGFSFVPTLTVLMEGHRKYSPVIKDEDHPVWHEFKKVIRNFRPEAVGFSVKSPSMPLALKMSEISKEINPGIKVIWGNSHASAMVDEVLSYPPVDFVVRGEGEETLVKLLYALEQKGEVGRIAGLSIKSNGKVTHFKDRPFIKDLDGIPFPSKHLLKSARGKMPVITSRGCPNRCKFCVDSSIWKRRVRFRSVENVVAEVREIIERYGVRVITFADPTFNQSKGRVYELCSAFIKNRLDFIWDCLLRLDNLDEEMLEVMYESGCRQVAIGVETGSERLLEEANKDLTTEQIRDAMSLIKRSRLISYAFFIVGLPSETTEDLERSGEFMKEINPDRVCISTFTPLPGCEYFDKLYGREGPAGDYPWERFSYYSPLYLQTRNNKSEAYMKAVRNIFLLAEKINARNKSYLIFFKRNLPFYLRHPRQLYYSICRFIEK